MREEKISWWLVGGVTLALLDLILIIFGFALSSFKFNVEFGWFLLFTQFPAVPLFWLISGFGGRLYYLKTVFYGKMEFFWGIFLGIISYFIIGALIGLLIEKIKSKKQKTN